MLLAAAELAAGDAFAFYAPPMQVDEMAGGTDVLVTRTGTGVGAVTVAVSADGGVSGAQLGLDFQAATPATLSWADGDRGWRVVHVPVLHNPAYAPWHSLALHLSGPTGGAILDPDTSRTLIHIPIVEHEANPAGYLSVMVPDATQQVSLRDDVGGLQLLVMRGGGTLGAVSTTVNCVDLTAVAGVDFTIPASPSLSWADGEGGVKSLIIPIIPRSQARGPLMFSCNIYGGTGNPGLRVSGVNVVITDHLAASAGTAACPASVRVSETAGTASIQVGRSGGTTGAVSLDWAAHAGSALDGVNLTLGSGTLHWADGDGADKTISIPVLPDGVPAPDLFASITYANPGGGLILPPYAGTTLAISDADGAAGLLAFTEGQVEVSEAAGTAVVSVSRRGGSSGAVSVDWASLDGSAVSGVQYLGGSGTLHWADGDGADKTISFPLVHDGTLGPVTAFYVTLSAATGGAVIDGSDPDYGPYADVVISDADGDAGSIGWLATAVQVHEGAGSVVLTARRSGGSAGPVTVPVTCLDISARLGTDYGIADVATLVWADGDSADKSITVPIIHDGLPGTDRAFRILLGPASGGAATTLPTPAVITILEDDQVLAAPVASGGVTLPGTDSGTAGTTTGTAAGGGGCGAGAVAMLLAMAGLLLGLRRR